MFERVEDTHGFRVEDWLTQSAPRTELKNRFKLFLHRFRDKAAADGGKRSVYRDRVVQMCQNNSASFEVSCLHLNEEEPTIAYFLPEAPREVLSILDEVCGASKIVDDFFKLICCIMSNMRLENSEKMN